MIDYIELGSAPCDENCVQVGEDNYGERSKNECKQFIELIRKTVGQEPEGARLTIKGFEHDFGRYYEVVCKFDDRNETAINYAFKCESESPTKWLNV